MPTKQLSQIYIATEAGAIALRLLELGYPTQFAADVALSIRQSADPESALEDARLMCANFCLTSGRAA
jgi:hypothetical protein